MKTIIVTGGAGFIASNFIKYMFRRYDNDIYIVNIDKLTYCGNLANLEEIEKRTNYTFFQNDICDEKAIDDILRIYKPDIIFNFAAQSHVDRSIQYPKEFLDTDIMGLFNLVFQSMKHKVPKFMHISCYDEDTRALTTEGLKRYNEIKTGDLVFSLNQETREIEVKPVEKVIVQYYEGNMIHFHGRRVNLKVTPNHNMFYINTVGDLKIDTSSELSKRSIFFMPEGNWIGIDNEYVNIDNYGKVKTKDLMYLLGIFIGDGITAYQKQSRKTKSGLNKEEYMRICRDEKGRFKSIQKSGNHICTIECYRVFLDIPENDKCRKRIETVLTNLGINWTQHKGKAGEHLYFSSKPLSILLDECGKGAYNKRIPRWALEYSPKYLKCLFDGLMDSDGSNGRVYTTVSEILVSNFCELSFKLGLKPNIGKTHNISYIDNRKIEGDAYHISFGISRKSISRKRNHIDRYIGKIWCLRVKDNKNFIVERKGRLDFCGNTDEVYGSIKHPKEATEKSILNPTSPYAGSKAASDILLSTYIKTYGFPAIMVRPCNNYGPNQYPEKLVPAVITRLLNDEKALLHGAGKEIREWIYVEDCCRAIDKIAEFGEIGEIYNIGSGIRLTNATMIQNILWSIYGKGSYSFNDFVKIIPNRPGNDKRYAINSNKTVKLIGDYLTVDIHNGLKMTVDWYQKHKDFWGKIDISANIYNDNYLR